MKLTVILLLACTLQVTARSFGQTVTLNVKDQPIEKVFTEIERQTGYTFFYGQELLDKVKTVTVNVKGASISETLNQCLKTTPFTYKIVNKTISISVTPHNNLSIQKLTPTPVDIKGRVIDENGKPIEGVTVTIKGTGIATSTNVNGEFTVSNDSKNAVLIFTSVNMETFELKVKDQEEIVVSLKPKVLGMGEVTVSTGYQTLPKERATGSFTFVDNALYNREISTDVLSRLSYITNSLVVDSRQGNNATKNYHIRGTSSVQLANSPLIVIDNLPYQGDISNINPNDVESITVLKDAAAASIWGVTSGNGVIVITTKKGKYNQKLQISVNSNITVSEEPNLFYFPQLSTSGFIDIETYLYGKGFYNSSLSNTLSWPIVSPVVEILNKRKLGLITASDSASQIDNLRNKDIRNDMQKFAYRRSFNQQHSISMSGGSANFNYALSVGYDNDLAIQKRNDYERITVKSINSYKPISNIEFNSNISYVQSTSNFNNPITYGALNVGSSSGIYPYLSLTDGNGNPASIPYQYRTGFVDSAGAGKLLNWSYKPLDELANSNNKSTNRDLLLSVSMKYRPIIPLTFEVIYQYENQRTDANSLYNQQTFFTRNLINKFTQINGQTVNRIIPLGSVLDLGNTVLIGNNFRGQISFDKQIKDNHHISIITGSEIRQTATNSNNYRTYGYKDNILTFGNIDFLNSYPTYDNITGSSYIPNNAGFSGTILRVASFYFNGSYSYKNRYVFSGSARTDATNTFGVKTNNRWQPLWSAGFSWKVSNETFYNIKLIPKLQFRATFGYRGNSSALSSALPVISYVSVNDVYTNLPYANISVASNPDLKWEKSGMFNLGIDFGIVSNRITGSFDFYTKNVTDLLSASNPIDPTTGFQSAPKNLGTIKGKGFEFQLNSINIDKKFKWTTNLSLSHNKDVLKSYSGSVISASTFFSNGNTIVVPVLNKVLYPVLSYKWEGLDASGNPQGLLNKQISTNYAAIQNDSVQNLVYNGSALPLYTGYFLNTFSYKQFSLSINISASLSYFYRKPTINYSALFSNAFGFYQDYQKRWQKPGDEFITTVPAMIYPANSSRDNFYANSEVNIQRADNIRLRDINLSYTLSKKSNLSILKNTQIFAYLNNVCILWKASKESLDPDYVFGSQGLTLPPQRTLTIGVKLNL